VTAIRRLRALALSLVFIASAQLSPAAELPNAAELPSAPTPQIPTVTTPGSISSFVTDADGASIASALVTLTRPAAAPITANTATDGSFTFANIPPGAFTLSITATGFATLQTSAELHPGEDLQLPNIALAVGATTSVQVTAARSEIAEAQVHLEEKQRVLGIVPNFYVSYISHPVPLTPRQKWDLAFRTMVDPMSFVLTGVNAGAQQADNLYDWGQGAQGFGKRYAAAYGTFLTGDLLGNAILPIWLHQDPRYFYKGTGSIRSRALYAIANTVICKGDNGHWQPGYSGILGGIAASGISNAYYPAANRSGARLTFEGAAIGIGVGSIQNLIQEFLIRKLTPHLPPPATGD
jgi:hypothetical protein